MNRYRVLLMCFLAVMMLTSVPLKTPEAVAQDSVPLITVAKIKALADRALRSPYTPRIGPHIAVPLGLSKSEILLTKQWGVDTPAGRHGFAVPTPPIGKFLLFLKKDSVAFMYACDTNGKLLAAGTVINRVFMLVTVDAATSGFEAELRFWNAHKLKKEN